MALRNIAECSRRFLILIVLLLLVYFPTCWSMSMIEIGHMFRDKRCIEGTVISMPDGPVITTASTQETSARPVQLITQTISEFATILPKLQSAMNMLPNFSPNLSPKFSSVPEQTSMNLINELAQYNDIEYKYYLINEDGPSHRKRFTIALQLGNEEYIADSTSIKKAQHAAAAKALSNTNFLQRPIKTKGRGKNKSVITPAMKLQELAMQFGKKMFYKEDAIDNVHSSQRDHDNKYVLFDEKDNLSTHHMYQYEYNQNTNQNNYFSNEIFNSILRFGSREYAGKGRSKQAARYNAAENALKEFQSLPSFGDGNNDHCQLGNEFANMINQNIGKSPIAIVYEIGAKKKINVAFELISKTGPGHAQVFGTRCSFGHLVADGTGSSKKKSKNDAAEKMLLVLRMQPDQCIDDSTQKTKRKRKKRKNKKKNQNLVKLNTENPSVYNNEINQIQQIIKKMEPRLSSLGDYSITNFGTGSLKKIANRATSEFLDKQSTPQSIKPSSKIDHKSNKIELSKPKAIRDKMETPLGNGNGNPLLPDMLEIGNQLNGKLNLNMDMYQTLAKDFLNADIEKAAGSLLRNINTNNLKQSKISPSATRDTFKEELLYMTDLLDVEVKFADFPTASNNMYMSLVSISTNPGRVCIGEGPDKEISQEKAAAEALFDLSEQGLDNLISRQG